MTTKVENMRKAINNFTWDKNKSRYSLLLGEAKVLQRIQNEWDRTDNIFTYGFIKGMRYMKAQQKKAKAGEING